MFKSYLKTAWRTLLHNKSFSILNIAGLAIGMAVALLIGLWVNYHFSYDRWLPNYRLTYQIRFNYNDNGVTRTKNEVCLPLKNALKNDVPQIAAVAATYGPVANALSVGNKKLVPLNLIAGADFLNIFQFPMLKGSRDQALKDVRSIVLTESTAKALFGEDDPINKDVLLFGSVNMKVTGVLKDLPANSSFRFDYITTLAFMTSDGWAKEAKTNWNQTTFQMYAGLMPGSSADQVESMSRMLVKKYAPAIYAASHEELTLQPLKDWHLYTEFQNGKAVGGLIEYMRLFSIIGILVLVIACINFMNLSTARSDKRAREVGVRKVIGSSRITLIMQFLLESLVVTSGSFALALIMVKSILPAFDELTGNPITIPFTNVWFWMIGIVYVAFTALLAGAKPAFYFSSFQPANVLRGMARTAQSAIFSRSAMVVLQFTCSIGLIISTIIVYQQIQYARNRPMGYNPNRLLETDAGSGNYVAMKNAVLTSGLVTSMTRSLNTPTWIRSHQNIDNWPGKSANEPMILTMNAVSDSDYFRTFGMEMKDGRNFAGSYGVDSLSVILNESAVKRMRLKQPIGQTITYSPGATPVHLHIVGVVKDALTNSPFAPPDPTFYVYQPSWTFTYTYRLAPGVNTQQALERLKVIFDKNDPTMPFQFHFVDQDYAKTFDLEMLIGKLAGIFAALSAFICCLGLFGLAAYIAERRTKEISIRKVLGASVPQVLILLTRDFLTLVTISCLLATPIAFYLLQSWIRQYYYRINIGPWPFIASALAAILITLVTVGFQAIKAAVASPIKSLKSD